MVCQHFFTYNSFEIFEDYRRKDNCWKGLLYKIKILVFTIMKVLYDHQTFTLQKYGGISRYYFELINRFKKDKNLECELACKYSENAYINSSDLFKDIETGESTEDFLYGVKFKGKAKIHRTLTRVGLASNPIILNKKNSVEIIKHNDFDIFHPTYYDPYFLKYIGNKPFVLTVHDMIHELYAGKFFKKNDKTIMAKKELAERAYRIIAISDSTKSDLIKLYKMDEGKIDIVYHGSSLKNENMINTDQSLPERYILFVGDRDLYKNFDFFLRSISKLLIEDEKLKLICAGGKPFNKIESNLIKNLKLSGKIFHRSIENDNYLSGLYNKALCFIFPSLYEGFGIPILEAFSCNCPVVISNTSSLPEVGGDAAHYFDPTDSASIYDAVKKVVYDYEFADKLREKGSEQLKKFSWEKCACETKRVYERLLEKI